MPKQNFQRPAPIGHSKAGKGQKDVPFGQQDWGRKKGNKPPKPAKGENPKGGKAQE